MGVSRYHLVDFTDLDFDRSRTVIALRDTGGVHRFDYVSNTWLRDDRMLGIFVGSPESSPITEGQAREIVERHGGRWIAPPTDP